MNRSTALALLAVAGVPLIVGAAAGQAIPKMSTTTVTVISNISTTTALSRSNGDWSFAIRLNDSAVAKGQTIALFFNLTAKDFFGQSQRAPPPGRR